MQTITGLFDTYEHARAAVHALEEAGIRSSDISIVAGGPHDYETDTVDEGATTGAEIGAGLGAAGGLLAGLGIVAIPGFGPVVAAGWLFATAIGALAGAGVGAATGGLVGALTSAGVSASEAEVLAESVRRGGAIVTARVNEAHAGPAAAILRHAQGIDIAERRRSYEAEGWDPAEKPAAGDEAYPDEREPALPPIV